MKILWPYLRKERRSGYFCLFLEREVKGNIFVNASGFFIDGECGSGDNKYQQKKLKRNFKEEGNKIEEIRDYRIWFAK